MTQATKRLPTHLFLASLGKTHLRPGGREATERILSFCNISEDTKVLEVAPNMGTTAIHLAQTYGCQVVGIDNHMPSVEQAKENIEAHGVAHLVDINHGNALKLPFADESFNVVINEAMLTMLPHNLKKKAIAEYHRVLKPGGQLVTHDLLLRQDPSVGNNEERLQQLRQLLVVNAQPLVAEGWYELIKEAAEFSHVEYQSGKMSLLSLKGLLVDEGWSGLLTMLQNAQQDEDSMDYFLELVKVFDDNDDFYGHITFTITK